MASFATTTSRTLGQSHPESSAAMSNGVYLPVSQSESRLRDVFARSVDNRSRILEFYEPTPDYDSEEDFSSLSNNSQEKHYQNGTMQRATKPNDKQQSELKPSRTFQNIPELEEFSNRYVSQEGSKARQCDTGANYLHDGAESARQKPTDSKNCSDDAKQRSRSKSIPALPVDNHKTPARSKAGGRKASGSLPAEKISSIVETTRTSVSMDITLTNGRAAKTSSSSSSATVRQKRSKEKQKEFLSNVTETKQFSVIPTENSYYDVLLGIQKPELEDPFSLIRELPRNEFFRFLKTGQELPENVSLSTGVVNNEYVWNKHWSVDETGQSQGQIRGVTDACFLRSSGNLVTTETKNSRVQVFETKSSKSLVTLGDTKDSTYDLKQKIRPACVCESHQDNIVLATDSNRLLLMDVGRNARILHEIPIRNKSDLHGIAITSSKKFILSDIGVRPSVGIYEDFGKLIREFGGSKFQLPSYVAWNDEYEVCAVSDSQQSCVLLYDSNGKFLNRIGHNTTCMYPSGTQANPAGTGPTGIQAGSLTYPTGICWMPHGRLLVADRSNNQIVLYDLRNNTFSTPLSKDRHGIKNPIALTSNSRDRIVVSEEHVQQNRCCLKMFRLDPVSL